MSMIRVRIAPSPTGVLHIGTARTALFNYLLAKHNDGQLILRIEDTDRVRSTKEHEDDIISSLQWLGLNWDEGPFRQTERFHLYRKVIDGLLESENAYKKEGAIYFRVDAKEDIEFEDLIHGKIKTPKESISDFVIVKSDGTPLFLLTNVVDDAEMKITHVIRGEDHISNTPRQILIGEALGFTPPIYAHIPLILTPERSKLSKRAGATSVREFKELGYLPAALINFMALLGWNPGDDREFFTLNELITEFDLAKVNKSGAVFDMVKLNSINAHYIRTMHARQLLTLIKDFYHEHPVISKISDAYLAKVVAIISQRLDRLADFYENSRYFFEELDYQSDLLIFKTSDRIKTAKGLEEALHILEKLDDSDWDTKKIQDILTLVVQNAELKNGDVFWPVRVALSGREKSPSPTELLWVLGKYESLVRLKYAITILK